MLLGRLAVDKAYQGLGIGTGLLSDAVRRTAQAAEIAGIRAILVHAISADAKRFYERYGFVASELDPLLLLISVADAARLYALSCFTSSSRFAFPMSFKNLTLEFQGSIAIATLHRPHKRNALS